MVFSGVSSSKMAMNTLHTELNKHIDVLERNVSRLQAEVDLHVNRINSANHNSSGKLTIIVTLIE